MKKLFSALILIVLGVMLIPVVANSVENYDIIAVDETFTAVEDDTTVETFTVENTIEEVQSVSVNGTELVLTTDYTVSGKVFSFAVDSSTTDDEVVIAYTYQTDMGTGIDGIMSVVLILFVVGIVGGAVAYIKFN